MSYYIWLILGVIAFVIEMQIPTFFALFSGIGFLASALLAYFFPEALFWQIIVASLFMFVGALIFRQRRMAETPTTNFGTHNEFVGIQGSALSELNKHTEGDVTLLEPILGSRLWPAITLDGVIEAGSEIKVVELRGNTLVVDKI
jgi:hypothetical protein